MYSQQPQHTTANPVVAGSHLSFELQHQSHEVPGKQRAFLWKLGWSSAGHHPDTNEELFRKHAPDSATGEERRSWPFDLGSGYWHWYEAVAYEFTKFIGIEDDSDG